MPSAGQSYASITSQAVMVMPRKSASPLPHIDVPNLQDLLPQPRPDQGETPEPPGSSNGGSDTTTTTPDDTTTRQQPGNQAVSMREASMFLQFLLGGGA